MVRTILGSNSYAVHEQVTKLVNAFKADHGESIERFDGSELQSVDDVLDAVRSISFLEPTKLVIVTQFSQNKELLDKLETIIEQTADSTQLILVDGKIDKRLGVYNFLKKKTEFMDMQELSGAQLVSWLRDRASDLGSSLSPVNAQFLIDRVGLNQQLLGQEVYKLAIASDEITKEKIRQLVEPTPQSKVFSLLDALFRGDLKRTMELYFDQRRQGEEPQKIVGMIVWQLQQLTLAVFAPQQSVSALTSAGMSPYSAQKALELGKKISKRNLAFYISELAELDAQSKTNADMESTLEVYFSEVASRQQAD